MLVNNILQNAQVDGSPVTIDKACGSRAMDQSWNRFSRIQKLLQTQAFLKKLDNNYEGAPANVFSSLVPGTPEEAPSQCC